MGCLAAANRGRTMPQWATVEQSTAHRYDMLWSQFDWFAAEGGCMEIELRLASAEDIPALRALIPVSVRVLSEGYYTPAQIESALVHIFGVDTQLIADGTYFV